MTPSLPNRTGTSREVGTQALAALVPADVLPSRRFDVHLDALTKLQRLADAGIVLVLRPRPPVGMDETLFMAALENIFDVPVREVRAGERAMDIMHTEHCTFQAALSAVNAARDAYERLLTELGQALTGR